MAHPPSPPGALLTRRAALARALGVTAGLALAPRPAAADFMCTVFGDCDYESPGFQFVVTDRETGRPLADVHALAEWIRYGRHGSGGPLIAQDAVTGEDGVARFAPWGPVRGAPMGLVLNADPLVTLFHSDYRTLLLNNAVNPGTDEKQRVRGFVLGIQSTGLMPFRGSSEEWVEELKRAAIVDSRGSMRVDRLGPSRSAYVRRLRRVLAASTVVPTRYREPGQLLWHLERSLKAFEGANP
jgi:hypothetical protein